MAHKYSVRTAAAETKDPAGPLEVRGRKASGPEALHEDRRHKANEPEFVHEDRRRKANAPEVVQEDFAPEPLTRRLSTRTAGSSPRGPPPKPDDPPPQIQQPRGPPQGRRRKVDERGRHALLVEASGGPRRQSVRRHSAWRRTHYAKHKFDAIGQATSAMIISQEWGLRCQAT